MKPVSASEQVEVLVRGAADTLSSNLLLERIQKSLKENKPLVVKAGFDPSSPDIHLGHTVLLKKLRQFQDLGHIVHFIIGDSTARIGDPSGRNQTRPMLSKEQIKKNANTYQDQAFKILNKSQTKILYNSQWIDKMSFADWMGLASKITVSQMLHRDDFQKRLKQEAPISLQELFYPLLQGYDSVQINSDIELGGTDQRFNLLMGRELQKEYDQDPQVVMMLPLLVGTDGVQKMSKSLSNHVGLEDKPSDWFGKIMSISDKTMSDYLKYLLPECEDEFKAINHPMEQKKFIAEKSMALVHSDDVIKSARNEFEKVFSNQGTPDFIPEILLKVGSHNLLKVLGDADLELSGGDIRRLFKQAAISIDGKKILDLDHMISVDDRSITVKLGKRKYLKISPKN